VSTLLGRFLEVSVATDDIAASVAFYEQLGFRQLVTGDMWPHLYGALTDGRVVVGLHQRQTSSPALTFVQPGLTHHLGRLLDAGIEPDQAHLGDESFHEIRLHDPSGQAITLLEARTYSPPQQHATESLCGYFSHYGLPAANVAATRAFWESAGLIALEEVDEPYPHQPLTSDHLDLAVHAPRTFSTPLLVFEADHLPERIARLKELKVPLAGKMPRGLTGRNAALIEAPEGTLLLIVSAAYSA
jgi:catechol 2,3-dioxygenase-like lactoylglutathione lyase family enzyme